MKLRPLFATAVLSLFASTALAAVPVVNTFTVAATAVSPVTVTAFTATDSDGNLAAYMCTDSNTKPSAGDARWSATAPSSCATTRIGSVTLYGWAKDSAGGVSNAKSASTSVVGTHAHTIAQVTGLQAALDSKAAETHDHDVVYQKKYANVIMVAKSGGDFTDPVAAVNSVTDASATNPYLIRIMPGVYDVGAQSMQLMEYMDVEGSGPNITVIDATPTVDGAFRVSSNAELRSLTIEHENGTAVMATGQYPSMRDLVIRSRSITGGTMGIKTYGLHLWNCQAQVENVKIINAGTDTPFWYDNISLYMGTYGGSAEDHTRIVDLRIEHSNGGFAVEMSQSGTPVTFEGLNLIVRNALPWQGGGALTVLNRAHIDTVGSAQGYEAIHAGLNINNSYIAGDQPAGIFGGDTVYVRNSEIVGVSNAPIFSTTAYVSNTKLVGSPGPGLARCIGCFDQQYNPIVLP